MQNNEKIEVPQTTTAAKFLPDDLFSYRPDPKAVLKRLLREALTLYDWGTDGKEHRVIYDSYEGLLNKFYLYPTFDCPLRCPFCYADGGVRKTAEMDAEKLFRITQEAMDAGYKTVTVVGGEPLFYYDIDKLLALWATLDKKGSKLVLRTAFSFALPEEKLDLISEVFDEITVSLDGDEKTHDANRGEGIYKTAVKNLDYCLKTGKCRLSICSVMSGEQFKGVPGKSIQQFCDARGIEKLVIQSPVPMGRADKPLSMQEPYYEWRKDEKMNLKYEPSFGCGLGRSLYMEPDGTLYACYALCSKEHILGDLSKEPLKAVLDRKKLLEYINSGVDTNEKCRKCDVRYLCGGKCRIWIRDNSDIFSGDFTCTKREGILERLNDARALLQKLEKEDS